jgi:NAD(P)-dependent dehydrogenase (short-subunit alcohol dehydrogenase family)
MNPLDMTGRTVMVTGASSGIGRETAILLSQLGARVILVGRNPGRLKETRQLMSEADHRLEVFDLCAETDCSNWLRELCGTAGPLSGLVHCAGVQQTMPLRSISLPDLEGVLKINLVAALNLAKAFRQKGLHAVQASLVFVASVLGLVGGVGNSVYSASKAGIIGLTRSLALELARDDIRVNSVAPGFVRTPMLNELSGQLTPEQMAAIEAAHPLGLGQPQDVANAVVFLLAPTARWITGATLVVDGGYTAH